MYLVDGQASGMQKGPRKIQGPFALSADGAGQAPSVIN